MERANTGRWLRRAASLAICLAFWQVASRFKLDLGIVTFQNVPSPVDVARAGLDFLQSPRFATHVASSVKRVLAGFALAALIGIALGLVIGRSRRLRDFLQTPLEILRPIPAVAWIPLAVLMFPSSELSMIYITFTGALFPIVLNTVHGVEHVDPRLIASARSLGSTRAAMLFEVILPAAAPNIVTGLVIGMGTCWFCLVTAEMISGQFGIGYYTWESYTLQNYPEIIVGMILIGLLGLGSSLLLRAAGKAALPWHRQENSR